MKIKLLYSNTKIGTVNIVWSQSELRMVRAQYEVIYVENHPGVADRN